MVCADYQKLLDRELSVEANLKAGDQTSVREEDLKILGNRVANANVELLRHVASCPECSKETDEISD